MLFYTDSVFASIGTQGQLTLCIVFGVAIGALALILRKITAILITAACGSYLLSRVVVTFIVNYEAADVMGGKGWILTLCSVIVLAVVSFIVQFKTRTRY